MPVFAGIVVGVLAGVVVNDALKPYGVPPLRIIAVALVFYLSFWLVRRALDSMRP